MTDGHLTGRTIFCIGMTQLINWGITFYMPGALGAAIMAETGWSQVVTFSGLTVAILVMGLAWGTLWGVGQVGARLLDVASGARISALRLNLIIGVLLPLCFLTGLAGNVSPAATAFFVLGYGAVNGLSTLVKAILPIVLFDPLHYARKTGVLLTPGFFLAALAPSAYAFLLEQYGIPGTLFVSLILALFITSISVVLWCRYPNSVVQNGDGKALHSD